MAGPTTLSLYKGVPNSASSPTMIPRAASIATRPCLISASRNLRTSSSLARYDWYEKKKKRWGYSRFIMIWMGSNLQQITYGGETKRIEEAKRSGGSGKFFSETHAKSRSMAPWSYVEKHEKTRNGHERYANIIVKLVKTYRLERIAEGAKAMADAIMAETTKKRNCGQS